MDYDYLFLLYQAGKRDELLVELKPMLKIWARETVLRARHKHNLDWRRELCDTAQSALLESIPKHLRNTFSSGKHLVYRLRFDALKAMKKAYREMRFPVLPTLEAVRKRRLRGVAAYKVTDPLKRIELWFRSDESEDGSRRNPSFEERFFSRRDAELDRYRTLAHLVCEAAISESRKLGWGFVEIMYTDELTVIGVARRTKTPRAVIRERLKHLRGLIAASASSELDSLGQEFLGFPWISAKVKGRVGHRNDRGEPSSHPRNAA